MKSEFIFNSLDAVCYPVPLMPHATPDSYLATNGSVVSYRCEPGFAFNGSHNTASITCDGIKWSEIDGQCDGWCLDAIC